MRRESATERHDDRVDNQVRLLVAARVHAGTESIQQFGLRAGRVHPPSRSAKSYVVTCNNAIKAMAPISTSEVTVNCPIAVACDSGPAPARGVQMMSLCFVSCSLALLLPLPLHLRPLRRQSRISLGRRRPAVHRPIAGNRQLTPK